MVEQQDAGHFRLLINHAEKGVEAVLGLHGVDVVLLLHHQFDTLFGVVNKQPEMSGILLFNQTP